MMKIGVISDTHGIFSLQFAEFLAPCDEVWHAGDWGGGDEFLDDVASALKNVVGVHGNCDGQNVRFRYPAHQFFEREGFKVLLTHIGGYPGHYDLRARALIDNYKPDIFVCGHSHILKVMRDASLDGMLCVNPGAAGLQGWQVVRTALRFNLDCGKISDLEVFELKR